MVEQVEELKLKWPSVDAAYLFVLPSYQLMATRFEAADNRLNALLTFAATLTTATPLLAKNVRPDISFSSPFLWLGLILFAIGAGFGLVGRVRGSIVLPDPTVIYEKSLHRSDWSFKMNQIAFAGQNFRKNQNTIERKGNAAIVQTIVLAVEVVAFVAWLGI